MDAPSRSKSAGSRSSSLVLRGAIAAAAVLMACTPAPLSQLTRSAKADFSETRSCPLHRVAARVIDSTPPPPARIAHDPERFVLWRKRAARRAPERRLIQVRGCDEDASYACWDYGGYVPNQHRRGMHRVSVGGVCIEQGVVP